VVASFKTTLTVGERILLAVARHTKQKQRRTLYSLRHTAIVTGIHAGISIETLAMNARTSTDMIDRFYGLHVLSALDKGTEIVDSVHAKQERYAARKAEKAGKERN